MGEDKGYGCGRSWIIPQVSPMSVISFYVFVFPLLSSHMAKSPAINSELCFVLVANFPHLAPGGYRSLLIGPTVEGILGGFSTITATVNAYLSDITPDGSRVMAFSRAIGFMMAGFAFGPVLGSILIQSTGDM